MGISAVVLTHNNESSLMMTLTSVKFCDEVIVIDDDSTDNTVRIAETFGAVVYPHLLNGNFSTQRNFGLSKATHEWVLFVDADEVVPEPLQQEIRTSVESVDKQGFFLKRDDVLWGRVLSHGETANVRLLRLARKDAGVWKRSVHEVWEIRGTVGTLTHALRHMPHPKVSDFLSDINDYSSLNAKYFFEHKIRTNVFEIIGYPIAKFIQNYIWRKGFLDGMPGMIVAMMMSFHSFLTRGKLWQLQRQVT